MSAVSERMPATVAMQHAARFLAAIADVTERTQIAGSLRRGLPTAGDIEIVCTPKLEQIEATDMFGQAVATHTVDRLGERMESLLQAGIVEKRSVRDGSFRWGGKHKRLTFQGAPIDLFCCDAERWGLILTIRTGPYQYSHQLVTERGKTLKVGTAPNGRPLTRLGLLPAHLKVQGGWLTSRTSGERIPTPTEESFYDAIGLPWVAPEDRR